MRVVLQVLYLVFNEGYTTSSGDDLQRTDLTAEAIRLTRMLHAQLPDDGEVTGLLRSCCSPTRAATHARAPTARSCRSTSRTGRAGTVR